MSTLIHLHTIGAIMSGIVGFNPIEYIQAYFLNFLSMGENPIIYRVADPSSDKGIQECFEIAKRVKELFTNTDSVFFLQLAINFVNNADLSVPAEYYITIINAMILDLTTFMLSNESQMTLCLNSFIEETATVDRTATHDTVEESTIYFESAQLLAAVLQLPLLQEIGHDAVQNGLLTLMLKCYELGMNAFGSELSLSIDPFLIIDTITIPIDTAGNELEFANNPAYELSLLIDILDRLDNTNIEVQQKLINTMLKCAFSKYNGQQIRLRPFAFVSIFDKITDDPNIYVSIINHSIRQSIEFIFLNKIIMHIMFSDPNQRRQMITKAIQFKNRVFDNGVKLKKNVSQNTYAAICSDFAQIREKMQENVTLGNLAQEHFTSLINANIFNFYKDILVCKELPLVVQQKVKKKLLPSPPQHTPDEINRMEKAAKVAEAELISMMEASAKKEAAAKKEEEKKAAKKAAAKEEAAKKEAAKKAAAKEEEEKKAAAKKEEEEKKAAAKKEEEEKKAAEKKEEAAKKAAAKNEEEAKKAAAKKEKKKAAAKKKKEKEIAELKEEGIAELEEEGIAELERIIIILTLDTGARTVEDTFGIKPIVKSMGCDMIVTGSRAYGMAGPDSDFDALVLIGSKKFLTINSFVDAFCIQICSNSNIQYNGNFVTTNCTIMNLFIVDANISVDISIVIVYMEEDVTITPDILDECIKNSSKTSSPKIMRAISDTRHMAELIDSFGQYKPLFISATLQIKQIFKANKMYSPLNEFFKSLSIVIMACKRFISLGKEQLDEALIIRDFFQYYADCRNWASEVINCGYVKEVSIGNHTGCAQIASPSGTILLSMKLSEFYRHLDRFQQIGSSEDPRSCSYNYEDFNCRLCISMEISRTGYDSRAQNIDDMVKSSMLLHIMAIRTDIIRTTNAIVIPDINIIKSGASTYSGMLLMGREIAELLCQESTRSNTEDIISDIITQSRYLFCSQYFNIEITHSIVYNIA